MRLDYIEIQNLLSFGMDPQRIDFNQGTTVLVGPNGGGKTNVLRAISLLHNLAHQPLENLGVPYSHRRNPLLEIPPHYRHATEESSVLLGIHFDRDNERELIELYIAGCIVASIEADSHQPGKSCDLALVRSKARELGREFVSSLSNCTVSARHDRRAQSEWVVEFCFTIGGISYSYALSSPGNLKQVSIGELFQKYTSQFKANTISSNPSEKLNCESLASWSISQLLPEPSERLNLKFNNVFNHDSDLKSDLLRAELIDDSNNNQLVTLRVVLDKIMYDSLRSDVDDNGFGSAVTYQQTPLRGGIVRTTTPSASSVLADLYKWKVGDLEDRKRFQRAQEIFRELRGTGETFDLRASLLAGDENKVSLEPMIISACGDSEVRANFAGSGATELVRLSSYLASDESAVILLDEPAARLHPTAQTHLLKFIEESKAQNVIISHSPSLLPLGNIRRIALDASQTSRVRVPLLVDDQRGEDSSSSEGNPAVSNKTDHKRSIAFQLHKDPTLRSILFAGAVIFVSGYTETIVYPQWFQSWLKSRKSDGNQTDTVLTHVRDVEFVNFNGDDNFPHYLRVAVAFGIPWGIIADGNSYRPDDNEPDIPLVARQIRDTYNRFGGSVDFPRRRGSKTNPSKNYGWFQSWKRLLEQCGVFSLATCWEKKEKKKVLCSQISCGQTWLETTTSCDHPDWHKKTPHAESFEDFYRNKPEFSNLKRNSSKPLQAWELIDTHPNCPKEVATLFDSMLQYWGKHRRFLLRASADR